jgi:hypothetical protein
MLYEKAKEIAKEVGVVNKVDADLKVEDYNQRRHGKLLLDAAKLVFGSICLGGVLRGELPHVMLIIGGFALAVALGVIGLNLAKKKKDGDDLPTKPVNDSTAKKE